MSLQPAESEIRENLREGGCTELETEEIMGCLQENDLHNAGKKIDVCRARQLAAMHESQKCIDRLDYLRFRLRRQ